MGDLIHESTPPLAFDHDGDPFQPPEDTVGWKVRRYTGQPGRPPVVWANKGIVHVGLDSDIDGLRRAVLNQPGSYRLYPVNKFGHEREPVAVVELTDDDEPTGALVMSGGRTAVVPDAIIPAETSLRFFDLYEKMIASRDAHDELMTRIVSTLVSSTAGIQQSTAGLLESASTTIRVANGIEALDRIEAPQLDIEGLTDKLAVVGQLKQTLAQLGETDRKTGTPWFVQLLNGPVGMGLMSVANNFAQHIAAAQKAAQQQAAKTSNGDDD